tara:strand:- start:2529 stop:2756 length:228 start_codon:yes stop_codon:yes gene_type:complete
VKKIKPFIPFLFPILILFLGSIIYKFLGFEPNFYTIIINIGLAFILSPRKKIIQTEKGKIKQITWLFLKKPIVLD